MFRHLPDGLRNHLGGLTRLSQLKRKTHERTISHKSVSSNPATARPDQTEPAQQARWYSRYHSSSLGGSRQKIRWRYWTRTLPSFIDRIQTGRVTDRNVVKCSSGPRALCLLGYVHKSQLCDFLLRDSGKCGASRRSLAMSSSLHVSNLSRSPSLFVSVLLLISSKRVAV